MSYAQRLLLLCLFSTASVQANIFTINSTTDAVDFDPGNAVCEATKDVGDCSIRAAIMETNALAGPDIINIPVGTFGLSLDGAGEDASSGELDIISSELIINGAGATQTILDANGVDRFFRLSDSSVEINDLTIQGGLTDADSNLGGAIALFSAVIDPNRLALNKVHLLNNQAKLGGAISAGQDVIVLIENSLLQGNSTVDVGAGNRKGAAIYCQGCDLTVLSSTIRDNIDEDSGKVVEVTSDGLITILNSTITGSFGGGIRAENGNVRIKFSTITDNGAQNLSFFSFPKTHVFEVSNSILQSATHDNCQDGDLPMSLGYNVLSDTSCSFAATGDLETSDAMLGALADNGGPTQTFLPAEDSPAIDHVPLAQCTDFNSVALLLDQRGVSRPQGVQCEAGSVELGSDLVYEDGFEDAGL